MRHVSRGARGALRGASRASRSSRGGAFIAELNGRQEQLDGAMEGLSPRLWRGLLLCLSGVTLVAVAVRAPLLGEGYAAPDTSHYLEVAHGVLNGGFPDNVRPPAYASLLALFDAVGADPVIAVVLLQNLVGMILPAAVLLIGWRFFSPAVGIVAGLLTAASPLMIVTEQFALAEYLFGVVLLAATVLLATAVLRMRADRVSWRLLVVTGVMFGLATLLRANGLLALMAIPIVLLIGAQSWRAALRASGIAVAAMLLVLAPWCLHNLIRFGDPNVSTVGNISLYAHAINSAGVPPDPDSADGRLALSVYNTGAPPTAVFNALIAEGKTRSEAAAAMGALARDAILRYPDVYLANSWSNFEQHRALFDPRTFGPNRDVDQIASTQEYFQVGALSSTGEALPRDRSLPGDSPFTRAPWQLAQALTRLLYLVTLGGVLALLLPFFGGLRQRLVAMTFLVVVLLGFLGSSSTAIYSQRYVIMFAPLVWVLLAATAVRIGEVAALAIRQHPRLRSQH